MFKWRLYCTDAGDTGWQEVWSSTPPVECPNDAGHSVNAESVQQLGQETQVIHQILERVVSLSFYTCVARVNYQTSVQGSIRAVLIGSFVDGTTTSYTVECLDATNRNVLVSNTFSNTDPEYALARIGTIASPPSGDFNLEVRVKRDDGTGNVYVREVVFVSDQSF